MLGLNEKLKDLVLHNKSINVGVVGLGQMGQALVSHLFSLKGFKVCAVADKDLTKIKAIAEIFPSFKDRFVLFINNKFYKYDDLDKENFENNIRNFGIGESKIINNSVNQKAQKTKNIQVNPKWQNINLSKLATQLEDIFKKEKNKKEEKKDSLILKPSKEFISSNLYSFNKNSNGSINGSINSINNFSSIRENLNSYLKLESFQIEKFNQLVLENKIIFTDSFYIFPFIDDIDVIVDATGYPDVGAEISLISLFGQKDVITLNVEMDITIGPILKKIALLNDQIYSLSAGDEPAVIKELYDYADCLGFKIIAAGKGKNNPLDPHANPTILKQYAKDKGSSPKMMTSFVDGTKSMVEMACLSNATGLVADCRGMHGPHANIKDILNIFKLKEHGGILNKEGVVDFVIGDLAPGVFLVYKTENKQVEKILNYLNLGNGPNFLIYKPYHLTSIETPLSIALAYFERQPWIVPKDNGLVSEVIAVAKKDLVSGEIIDGIGGYTIYGLLDSYENAKNLNCLPIGIAQGAVLKRNVKKDDIILFSDVEFPEKTVLQKLRKLQDDLIQEKKS